MRCTGLHSASKLSVSQALVYELRYQWHSDSGCHPVRYCYIVTPPPATGIARNLSRGTLEARRAQFEVEGEEQPGFLGRGQPHQVGGLRERCNFPSKFWAPWVSDTVKGRRGMADDR